MGLFIYDHLGGRKRLPATRTLDLTHDAAGQPLKPGQYTRGFEYSDCWVEDARMVVLNARDAADRGATGVTRTRAVSAERKADHWAIDVQDRDGGEPRRIRAKAVVNAAGPWVGRVLNGALRINAEAKVRLEQGSHIVVKRLYDHDRCYIFQNADGRIIFAIPYEGDFTLIGTTDRDYDGDPAHGEASAEEIDYLCEAASDYFAKPVTRADIVWVYSGVRPLYDEGHKEGQAQAATRDYVLSLEAEAGAPLLSVFGGKLTTYRRLAEHALELLTPHLPKAGSNKGWTGRTRGLPRTGLRRNPDGGRGRSSRHHGMGQDDGRHPMASLEARASGRCRAGRGSRCLSGPDDRCVGRPTELSRRCRARPRGARDLTRPE